MKKTKMFMLVLTSAVLALTPVTANAVSYTHLEVPDLFLTGISIMIFF